MWVFRKLFFHYVIIGVKLFNVDSNSGKLIFIFKVLINFALHNPADLAMFGRK